MKIAYKLIIGLLSFFLAIFSPQTVIAYTCEEQGNNPFLYLDTIPRGAEIISGTPIVLELRVNTCGQSVGVMQVAVAYPSTHFSSDVDGYWASWITARVNISGSVFPFFTPANSVPPGKNFSISTPYAYNHKIIFTAGVGGQTGFNGDGKVATFQLNPYNTGDVSLTFSDIVMRFGINSVPLGTSPTYTATILGEPSATSTPEPTPYPTVTPIPTITPTPTPTVTATPSATPVVVDPTPIVNSTTLFDDVNIVDVSDNFSGRSGTTRTSSGIDELEVVEEDNTVPAPPLDLTPRPNATPFKLPESYAQEPQAQGEVMSVQGLRDLLIPGKSKADKTVVMVNFISTLTFLVLLSVVVWKMILNTRSSKLKSKYIHEIISGELAALESKMEIIKEKEGKEKFENEFSQSVDHILNEITPEEKNESKNTPQAK